MSAPRRSAMTPGQIASSVALPSDVEALLHPEGLASRAVLADELVAELFVKPPGVENRADMEFRRGCSVLEVGLSTTYQAGPEASSFRVRGYIDVSKVPASPTGASNDESIGLGDEELSILDHGAEFIYVKVVEKLKDFPR